MSFQKFYPYDKELEFRAAGSAAVTSTGYIGTQKDLKGSVLTEMVMVINLEAIDIASTNEVYTWRVVGSNVADRSDCTVLGVAQVGDASTITIETVDTVAGTRVEIRFATEKNGVNYRYLDLHLTAAGTTPSVTFSAFASKRQ